jgi:hypothetical protein
MRIVAPLACCLGLFAAGVTLGCGANKMTKTGWSTVTIQGHTYRVTQVGSVTLDLNP